MRWRRLRPLGWQWLLLAVSVAGRGQAAENHAEQSHAEQSHAEQNQAVGTNAAGASAPEEVSLGSAGPAADVAEAEAPHGFSPGWLDWNVPQECPQLDYIEGRIVEWLGAPPLVSDDLAVRGRLRWSDDGWNVSVSVLLNGRSGQRSIRVESCTDAADFVALTVALSVNPELSPLAPADPGDSEAEMDAPNSPEDGEDQSEQPPPSTDATNVQTEPPREARELSLLLGVSGELSAGALPGVHGGVALRVGLEGLLPRSRLLVAGRFLPQVDEAAPGATGPIGFSLLAGRLAGCYELLRARVSLLPCAAVELGSIHGGQVSGSVLPLGGEALWAALGAGLFADVRVTDHLRPFIGMELLVPIASTQFVLDDESAFYETTIGFRAVLGFSAFFDLE